MQMLNRQHERNTEALERNCLMNRIVLVGLESLSTKNMQMPMWAINILFNPQTHIKVVEGENSSILKHDRNDSHFKDVP